MIDVVNVQENAIAAIASVLKDHWPRMEVRVSRHVRLMVPNVLDLQRERDAEPPRISKSEYETARAAYETALASAINFHEPISLALAEEAARAVWRTLEPSSAEQAQVVDDEPARAGP